MKDNTTHANSYFSIEKEVYLSEKEKLAPNYFEEMGNFYISTLVHRKQHIIDARNYYASVRNILDFEYLEDMYGMQNPIDLTFTNVIKPRVNALIGLSILSEPEFSVSYIDNETAKKVEKEKIEKTLAELQQKLKINVKQNNADVAEAEGAKPAPKQMPGADTKEWLEKLAKKYGDNYQSAYQVAAQHILRLVETDIDLDLGTIKKEVSKDYFVSGEGYTRERFHGEGKTPTKIHIRPEELFTNRPRGDRDLKNTDVFVHKKRMTIHNILKLLGDTISKAEAEKLFTSYTTLSDTITMPHGPGDVNVDIKSGTQMDTVPFGALKTGWSNAPLNGEGSLPGDLVDFYHVEWLASTRIPDGKGGHVYREDRYEVYRIGYEIYIGGRRCDEAPRTKDKPWKTNSSYTGIINTSTTGEIASLVNDMRELQDLYDILMFFRNNLVANSGISGSRVNVAAIPKVLGDKFMERLTKWITIRKQGIELVDPTEEGANLFQHYGDFQASIKGDGITSINAILESLLLQADIISGVPRQMLGIIEQRDAVENVKVGMNQVSVLSLEMFKDIDKMMSRGMQKSLDNYKYAYKKHPLEGVYRNGMATVVFMLQPDDFAMTDYQVSVTSAGVESAKLLKIQTLAKEFASAGALPPEVLVKIINKRSVVEIENILETAMAEHQEKLMNVQQLQQQLEEAGTQINQLEAEIKRLENNKAANEKAKLALEEKVKKSEQALASRELDIKEAKDRADIKIDKQEVALKRETVELEKDQLIYGDGPEKEIKNNF
jgi:hypothetical protein